MTETACRNAALHQWHPEGYLQHHAWARDALKVATQRRCPGCGRHEIWTPKRRNLRLRGADWPWRTCVGTDDGKRCTNEPICERFLADDVVTTEVVTGEWVPVCYRHTGLAVIGG